MGGGLMQLVAYGAQDIYLTRDIQITFFKVVYVADILTFPWRALNSHTFEQIMEMKLLQQYQEMEI